MTWNVSILDTRDDNGICVSYRTESEARAEAERSLQSGSWSVRVWSC